MLTLNTRAGACVRRAVADLFGLARRECTVEMVRDPGPEQDGPIHPKATPQHEPDRLRSPSQRVRHVGRGLSCPCAIAGPTLLSCVHSRPPS